MQILASWPNGFTVLGDNDVLALGYGDTPSEQNTWFPQDEDEHGELLALLIAATPVETTALKGLAVDVTQDYDPDYSGAIRGLYVLTADEQPNIYLATAKDMETLVAAMEDYTA